MLKQPKYQKLPDYAVRFIGYSARIIARKGNAEYAYVHFVSGAAALFADEGRVLVPKRHALSSAIADLPFCIDELKSLIKSIAPDSDRHQIEMRRGEVEIVVNRGADVDRFVSQTTRRYRKIEPILEQAEKVGSGIKRLPYADYIDEIGRTGVCRVVFYGDAFFVDGKLVYCPEQQTLLLKPSEDKRSFLLIPNSECQRGTW
ncbi:MAG: hypothetical protein ACLPXW_21325 [Xanthobacteraceae bacterium]